MQLLYKTNKKSYTKIAISKKSTSINITQKSCVVDLMLMLEGRKEGQQPVAGGIEQILGLVDATILTLNGHAYFAAIQNRHNEAICMST